jgi:hypothetical protein
MCSEYSIGMRVVNDVLVADWWAAPTFLKAWLTVDTNSKATETNRGLIRIRYTDIGGQLHWRTMWRESHFVWERVDGLAEMKDVQRDRMNLGRPVRPWLEEVFTYFLANS